MELVHERGPEDVHRMAACGRPFPEAHGKAVIGPETPGKTEGTLEFLGKTHFHPLDSKFGAENKAGVISQTGKKMGP